MEQSHDKSTDSTVIDVRPEQNNSKIALVLASIKAFLKKLVEMIAETFKSALKMVRKVAKNPAFIGGMIGAGLFLGTLLSGVLPFLTALSLTVKIIAGAVSFLVGAALATGVIEFKNAIHKHNLGAEEREKAKNTSDNAKNIIRLAERSVKGFNKLDIPFDHPKALQYMKLQEMINYADNRLGTLEKAMQCNRIFEQIQGPKYFEYSLHRQIAAANEREDLYNQEQASVNYSPAFFNKKSEQKSAQDQSETLNVASLNAPSLNA